jgi:hypothetical protein
MQMLTPSMMGQDSACRPAGDVLSAARQARKSSRGERHHASARPDHPTVPGYAYSPAMKNVNVIWNDDTLSKYLSDPKAFVPGDKMAFVGINDPTKLGDLLAYRNQATK